MLITASPDHSQRSSSSLSVEPPELDDFAEFCAELTLENGQPLELYAGQRVMLTPYFNGTIETLILVPKKNGKTTLMGALAIYHLVVTPDAECVIAAASRDQAQIMLKQARGFIKRSPALQGLMEVKQREITSLVDEGRIRVLASDVDTADGVIPTLALVDELHRHKNADLYGVFRDGLGPRGGKMITISTAGDDEMSPLGLMRSAAYAWPTVRREGAHMFAESAAGDYVMHEWSLLPEDDRSDMTVVARANPAPWQDEEALRRRFESPSMTAWQWARFACGVWMRGEDAAISPVDWSECGDPDLRIPDGAGVWLGLDLGWKWDTTAVVPVWVAGPDDFRVGAPAVIEPPRDGTSTDEEDIVNPILDMRRRWKVLGLVFDRNAGGQQLAQMLEKQHGMKVIDHSQDPAPMALASMRLAEVVRAGQLKHPNDPVLSAHVLAAKSKPTTGEKWRLVKHKAPIDAAIALAMALTAAGMKRSRPRFEVIS